MFYKEKQKPKKPRAYRCEYEGKKYLDVTEYWLETSFVTPNLDSKIIELMHKKKVGADI